MAWRVTPPGFLCVLIAVACSLNGVSCDDYNSPPVIAYIGPIVGIIILVSMIVCICKVCCCNKTTVSGATMINPYPLLQQQQQQQQQPQVQQVFINTTTPQQPQQLTSYPPPPHNAMQSYGVQPSPYGIPLPPKYEESRSSRLVHQPPFNTNPGHDNPSYLSDQPTAPTLY